MKLLIFVCLLSAATAQAQIPLGGITGPSSAPSTGGPAPVGTPVCGMTSYTSSPSISYTPRVAGDTVFLSVWAGGSAATYSNETDNQGQSALLVSGAESGSYAGVYEYASIASGVTYLSATLSSNGYTTYCISEWSGVTGVGATSQGGVLTTGSSSPWSYSASLTIGAAHHYVLGVATYAGSAAIAPTATSGTLAGYEKYAYRSAFQQYNTSTSSGGVLLSGTISGPAADVTLRVTMIEIE